MARLGRGWRALVRTQRGSAVYYLILAYDAALVGSAAWLLSRPGWLPLAGGLGVLLEGMSLGLVLLHRWLGRRSREA